MIIDKFSKVNFGEIKFFFSIFPKQQSFLYHEWQSTASSTPKHRLRQGLTIQKVILLQTITIITATHNYPLATEPPGHLQTNTQIIPLDAENYPNKNSNRHPPRNLTSLHAKDTTGSTKRTGTSLKRMKRKKEDANQNNIVKMNTKSCTLRKASLRLPIPSPPSLSRVLRKGVDTTNFEAKDVFSAESCCMWHHPRLLLSLSNGAKVCQIFGMKDDFCWKLTMRDLEKFSNVCTLGNSLVTTLNV